VKVFDWTALLRHDSIFASLADQDLEWLLGDEASTECSYEPGAVIVREGETGDSIFLIGSGSAEAVLSIARDRTILLSRMLSGETFGEMGLFGRKPRSATVQARENCVVLEIKGSALRSLAAANPELAFRILLPVSERLRGKNEQILRLHLENVAAANRAKDDFLAMLGHELRNPLGALTTAIDVLNALGDPNDQAARMRAIIVRQTQHLSRLVEDLLDVSRLVSGKVILHREVVDLREVAERALASFREAGKVTGHVMSSMGAPATVYGDPTRLEQVVSNLLDNAVKYTPLGGRVELTVRPDAQDALLIVRDTGPGISRDALPFIFDLFVQADQTLERTGGGLGVGLTIAKRLVEQHGGTISASSAGRNQGSEFIVRLPLISEVIVQPKPSEAMSLLVRACQILIIEDNRDFREGLRLLLESWGHRVQEASSGAEGLKMFFNARPEILLVDLGLPGVDGYAVARGVRSAPGSDAIFMVAITGYGADNDRRQSKEAGFDAHLTKPVSPQQLAEVLRMSEMTEEQRRAVRRRSIDY
jgi:signal transduction histidine kinase/CheY-like chemotaxis protein